MWSLWGGEFINWGMNIWRPQIKCIIIIIIIIICLNSRKQSNNWFIVCFDYYFQLRGMASFLNVLRYGLKLFFRKQWKKILWIYFIWTCTSVSHVIQENKQFICAILKQFNHEQPKIKSSLFFSSVYHLVQADSTVPRLLQLGTALHFASIELTSQKLHTIIVPITSITLHCVLNLSHSKYSSN